ncbi:hypothetical protein FQA39_LY08555 [Lamprigera yunnana]|nr:hypothetical protein FQA39_LY08555 [Lamprigera yunnana]
MEEDNLGMGLDLCSKRNLQGKGKMTRLKENELPFQLVGMTIDDLYREMENIHEIVEPIPSDSDIDVSDIEQPTVDVRSKDDDIFISESEETEFDLPLATVRNFIAHNAAPIPIITQVYNPPTWSNISK